jgi:hypothetical protein
MTSKSCWLTWCLVISLAFPGFAKQDCCCADDRESHSCCCCRDQDSPPSPSSSCCSKRAAEAEKRDCCSRQPGTSSKCDGKCKYNQLHRPTAIAINHVKRIPSRSLITSPFFIQLKPTSSEPEARDYCLKVRGPPNGERLIVVYCRWLN